MKKTCFYCPEKIFQAGGGATVAQNVLREYDNGLKNIFIVSNNTVIPEEIEEKYIVRRIAYPSNKLFSVFYDFFITPLLLFKYRKERLMCLNSIVPLLYPFHTDVYFQMRMFYFEEFDTLDKKIKNFLGRLSLKKAKNIFVASEDHKNDLIKYLKIKSSKIHVAPLGFDFSYEKEKLESNGLKKYPYWLFISIFRPYKNIDGLIKAYGEIYFKRKDIPNLILIGDFPANYKEIGFYKKKIMNLIKKYNLELKVEFLGLKNHEESMKYLANAQLFIFPSRFEGFGLPILEAMALKIPIISSSAHSLAEVGGDCIEYFNPENEWELETKLDDFLINGYSKDIEKANLRSKLFNWKNTCEIIKSTENK